MDKKTNILPFGNRLLVKRTKETDSKIILPDSVNMKTLEFSFKGVVLGVGDGVKKIKAGDNVMFIRPMLPYLCMTLNGDECFLLTEDQDILAILSQ